MKFFASPLVAAAVAVLAATGAIAQRITGTDSCVNACYNVSVAVTKCSNLTDAGVVSCICPVSSQVALLNTCHSCINSLNGTTAYEVSAINSLFTACSTNGSSASGTSGVNNNAGTATKSSASPTPSNGAFRSSMPIAVSAVALIGAVAALLV
ncbi:hypothetical protein EMMF5_001506 [Cystobasidiomycetes sp. EMM_F5]